MIHFKISFILTTVFISTYGAYKYSLEMSSVAGILKYLNIPWEGSCPVNVTLIPNHPLFTDEGTVGRCPTIYEVLLLPPSSEPSMVIIGRCSSDCLMSSCSTRGPFRCENKEEKLTVLSVNPFTGLKEKKHEIIPVGCYCTSQKAHLVKPIRLYFIN